MHKKIISHNVFDISVYIIGVTLKLFGQIEKSVILLESLYDQLQRRNDDFKNNLIPHLYDCYLLIVTEFGMNRNDINRGKIYCKKILVFNKEDFFALANLAIFQYKTGEKEESEETTNLLQKYHPNIPLTHLDMAFFRILQKQYSLAFNHYAELIKHNYEDLEFNPLEAVEFLDIEYKKTKESALLYGRGLISISYGDKILAKADLKQFLKKADKDTYRPMREHAQKLLEKK